MADQTYMRNVPHGTQETGTRAMISRPQLPFFGVRYPGQPLEIVGAYGADFTGLRCTTVIYYRQLDAQTRPIIEIDPKSNQMHERRSFPIAMFITIQPQDDSAIIGKDSYILSAHRDEIEAYLSSLVNVTKQLAVQTQPQANTGGAAGGLSQQMASAQVTLSDLFSACLQEFKDKSAGIAQSQPIAHLAVGSRHLATDGTLVDHLDLNADFFNRIAPRLLYPFYSDKLGGTMVMLPDAIITSAFPKGHFEPTRGQWIVEDATLGGRRDPNNPAELLITFNQQSHVFATLQRHTKPAVVLAKPTTFKQAIKQAAAKLDQAQGKTESAVIRHDANKLAARVDKRTDEGGGFCEQYPEHCQNPELAKLESKYRQLDPEGKIIDAMMKWEQHREEEAKAEQAAMDPWSPTFNKKLYLAKAGVSEAEILKIRQDLTALEGQPGSQEPAETQAAEKKVVADIKAIQDDNARAYALGHFMESLHVNAGKRLEYDAKTLKELPVTSMTDDYWASIAGEVIRDAKDYQLSMSDERRRARDKHQAEDDHGVTDPEDKAMAQVIGGSAKRRDYILKHLDKNGWGFERDAGRAIEQDRAIQLLGNSGGDVMTALGPGATKVVRDRIAAAKRVIWTDEKQFIETMGGIIQAIRNEGLLGVERKQFGNELADLCIHWMKILIRRSPWDVGAYTRAHIDYLQWANDAATAAPPTSDAQARNNQYLKELQDAGQSSSAAYKAAMNLRHMLNGELDLLEFKPVASGRPAVPSQRIAEK